MADHLSDIVLRLLRNREPPSSYDRESPSSYDRESPSSYARESPFQALKSSLDDSPPDPSRIAESKRLLLAPYTPSTRLFSPHQAIQQALALADQRIRTRFPRSEAHLFSEVIHHRSLPPHLGFSAKRYLLHLLLPPPPSSSTLTLQATKLFAKIIDDACKKVVASSTSDCLEELVVSAIINATSDDDMIRAALVQHLLLSTAPRPLGRERLDAYKQEFTSAILELAEGYPSAEAAGAALAAAADRWPGGGAHTRDEVKRFVSLGREAIPSMKRDRLDEVVKSAINRVSEGRDKLCPLKDAVNVLSQMPPDSSTAEIIVHRLVFHSKPFPTEQYSSLMRSCMNHLINLSVNQTSERSIDVEEFACFFSPDVILMMGMTFQDNHTIEENIGGSSSSQANGAIRDRLEMNYQAPYPEMEAKIDKVLRDALMDAVERLKSSTAMEESSNNDILEAIIYAFQDAMELEPSLNRDLLRQVLINSKEPPPESLVDQAFMRIVFSATDSINRGDCRKDMVDYLLDAIEDQIKSPIMKQALVERLVFSCRPPPAELSGGHVLRTSIAAGVWQLAEELSVERPLEAMAGAIRRLPLAGPVVKKILLLIVSNVEEPSKTSPHERMPRPKRHPQKAAPRKPAPAPPSPPAPAPPPPPPPPPKKLKPKSPPPSWISMKQKFRVRN